MNNITFHREEDFYFTVGDEDAQQKCTLDENFPHFIAVSAPDRNKVRVLLAEIVFWASTNTGKLTKNGAAVDISMRGIGEELADSAEDMTNMQLESVARMGMYNYIEALRHSTESPDQATLLITANDSIYCGRVHFYDYLSHKYSKCDCIVFIVASGEDKDRVFQALDDDLQKSVPLVFAVISKTVYGSDVGAEKYLLECIPELGEKLKGREYVSVWYNPVGFTDSGERRTADDPRPIGEDSVFWSAVEKAASSRLKSDSEAIERSSKIIEELRSVYQLKSKRRQILLDRARKEYAHCVVSVYASDNLFSLCKGILPKYTEE